MLLRRLLVALGFSALLASVAPLTAQAWMWDQNDNRIDDRLEAVDANGLAAAHVNNDLDQRLAIFVFPETTPIGYGVYVGYDHFPTDPDVAALQATGASLLWRPRFINYLRARATFAEIQALAAQPGVTRVEAWPVFYRTNDIATRTLRARAAEGGVGAGMFPSVWRDLGITGRGVVVGILDTGVNDEAMDSYPGHESLVGKFVGGGDFSNADESQNTPPDSSENPVNATDPLGDFHGTHVAGTAIGSGGPQGVLGGLSPGPYAGMAPDARLVDCKVLTDAGAGGGSAAALEWCIVHRNTLWGTDPDGTVYRGVQVVNMSLGGLSESDGTDANSAAVNAAVKAGIVVCVATGNDGNTAYMPSPAAADLDIAVGALQDANSLQHPDDIVADYSNEGPRMSDGDADHFDEMKPSVLGSGSDVVSALGDPTTDGTRYHNINGTSMATPTIAGLCALIRQANPNLAPQQVRDILQNTAEHRTDHGQQPPSAADPFDLDPNYHPSWGWGEPDAYAAVKEALNSNTTQVIAESGTPSLIMGQLQIQVRWTTQREIGVTRFAVYRAPDLGGYAGDFAVVSPDVAPIGHAAIERTSNRTPYSWTDTDPSLAAGTPYWYQVRWFDASGRDHVEPAFRVATDTPPVRARANWVISHNVIDNDIFARFGSGTDPNDAPFVRPCGGSTAADSARNVTPIGFGGPLRRHYFHADLTDLDMVGNFLPPSAANPWFLSVLEKGFVNTEGIVDSFSVTVYGPSSSTTYRSLDPSEVTVEGQTTTFWIPLDPVTTPNHSPVLDPIGDRGVGEGLTLNFQVHAADPDGQALTYTAAPLPNHASFNAGTRTFDFMPSFGQAGAYAILFRVADSMGAADSELVTITVASRMPGSNTAPVLDPIADKSVPANSALGFKATAHDYEGGPLTFAAAPLPSGAGIDAGTGAFAWTPLPAQEGIYRVTFHVTDSGGAADSQAVNITVTPAAQELPSNCEPDTATFTGTIGVNVQGLMDVNAFHSFVVPDNAAAIQGALEWSGAPAIDLDLYLLDPAGNVVGSGATATVDPEHLIYVNPAPGTYQWKVSSYDNPNPDLAYTVTGIVCIREPLAAGDPLGPVALALAQSQPNPFTRSCLIRFALPRSGPVNLGIFDLAGRRVKTLAQGTLEAGFHQRVWDGRTEAGVVAPAGVYFYRLDALRQARVKRMVFLR